MEYYSALKRKEILIHATKQTNLEDIKPVTKGQILWFHLFEVSRVVSFVEIEIRIVVAGIGGKRDWGFGV